MLRLHRIRLTDFRGVAAREVAFTEHGVTLVCGPNEIGKSSLVDALDLLIDLPATSRHSRVTATQPTGRDVGPEVEAELSLGPHRLVYRKRWLRSAQTELRILSPTPAQYSGPQAHERFNGMLAENGVDKDLWRRLRVDQGAPLGQASVGGYASVPAMAGEAEQLSAVRRGPEEELFEKAKAEFERYFTEKRFQPTGDYKAAREALDAANAAYAEAKANLAAADGDLADHQRTRRQIADGAEQLNAAAARLRQLEEQSKEAAEASAKQLALEAVLADAEAIARQEAEVERLAERLTTNQSDAATQQTELTAAEHEAALADERLRASAAERESAKAAARLAAADVAWRRDQAEAEQAQAILARLEAAQHRLDEAEARLEACQVTDIVLAGIDEAHRAWEKAHDQLTANAATVAVTRLGDPQVLIDGAPAAVGGARDSADGATDPLAGSSDSGASADSGEANTTTLPVLETRTIEVPGSVRVVVRPGSDEQERRAAERKTLDRYRELCAAANVADLGAAKHAEQQWRAARDEQRDAKTAIKAAQYDESAAQLRSRLAVLREKIASHEATSPASAAN
ncbi:AAA family ATPase, partial [Actinospica sp. MGRD01-02]